MFTRPMRGGIAVAHKTFGTEPDLRAWLLKESKGFRREMCLTLAEDPAWSSQAWQQLSRSVDALAAGKPYRLRGWELPDDHPARVLGANVDFVLDSTTCCGSFRNRRFVNLDMYCARLRELSEQSRAPR
jgi:hypothetical protein